MLIIASLDVLIASLRLAIVPMLRRRCLDNYHYEHPTVNPFTCTSFITMNITTMNNLFTTTTNNPFTIMHLISVRRSPLFLSTASTHATCSPGRKRFISMAVQHRGQDDDGIATSERSMCHGQVTWDE